MVTETIEGTASCVKVSENIIKMEDSLLVIFETMCIVQGLWPDF